MLLRKQEEEERRKQTVSFEDPTLRTEEESEKGNDSPTESIKLHRSDRRIGDLDPIHHLQAQKRIYVSSDVLLRKQNNAQAHLPRPTIKHQQLSSLRPQEHLPPVRREPGRHER